MVTIIEFSFILIQYKKDFFEQKKPILIINKSLIAFITIILKEIFFLSLD
jgi:hypothetical protein